MVKKVIRNFEVEYLQVLDENGNADEELMPKLTDKQIKELYENMILVRTFDDKAFSMQRQGRIGSYLQVKGQEASQVGSVFALKNKDWLFPMYRSSGALLVRKQPMHLLYLYWGGDERGLRSPDSVNNFPMAIPVGTQTPHAVGAAWASKILGKKEVSMVFLGDGATSKADFHSAMNFAGVFKTPSVIICENNQYAISVPREVQTASETIAQKGIAYGIKSIQADGNDVFAVYKAVKQAVDDARSGKGPTFIECLTYRIGDHSTSDDAKKYRKEKEVREWLKKDPIARLEKYMEKKKLLNNTYKKKVLKQARETVEKEVKKYEGFAPPHREDIFRYTFEEMPYQLKEQFEEFKKDG